MNPALHLIDDDAVSDFSASSRVLRGEVRGTVGFIIFNGCADDSHRRGLIGARFVFKFRVSELRQMSNLPGDNSVPCNSPASISR